MLQAYTKECFLPAFGPPNLIASARTGFVAVPRMNTCTVRVSESIAEIAVGARGEERTENLGKFYVLDLMPFVHASFSFARRGQFSAESGVYLTFF